MQASQATGFDGLRRPLTLEKVGAGNRVPVAPNYVFELCHLPSRVELALVLLDAAVRAPKTFSATWWLERVKEQKAQAYWLPAVVPFEHRGGCNGVKPGRREDDPPDVLVAKARKQKHGWIFIPGVETYIAEYPCQHPKTEVKGTFYCTRFDRPTAHGREFVLEHDDQADARWRHGLVLQGVLPSPDPLHCERKMRSPLAAVRRHEGKNEKYHQSLTTQNEAYVALMQSAIRPGDAGDPLVETAAPSSPSADEPKKGAARVKA